MDTESIQFIFATQPGETSSYWPISNAVYERLADLYRRRESNREFQFEVGKQKIRAIECVFCETARNPEHFEMQGNAIAFKLEDGASYIRQFGS